MPGNIGIMELVVVLVLVLIIFGPKRLPELGRSVGRGIREFKGSIEGKNDDDDEKPQTINSTATEEEPISTPAAEKQESSTGA